MQRAFWQPRSRGGRTSRKTFSWVDQTIDYFMHSIYPLLVAHREERIVRMFNIPPACRQLWTSAESGTPVDLAKLLDLCRSLT